MNAPTADDLIRALPGAPIEVLGHMLEESPELASARAANGVSVLLLALYHRRRDVAELLLRARPPLDVFDAAALDRSDRLAELLDANPALANARSPDGFTPLGYAAFFGGLAAAQVLLERGADPNAHATNPLAVAPLHSAVASKNKDVVALLLARGADANARQQEGYTPLMGAAAEGDEVSVLLLLAHRADPRLVSESGKTAADIAAEKGHSKIEQKLRGVTG